MKGIEKMNNLLEMKHVAVNFAAYGGTVQAVRDISFSIEDKKGRLRGLCDYTLYQ